MKVSVHKDYTVNLGNKNWAKGGFGIEVEISNEDEEIIEGTKEKIADTIDRWITAEVEIEKKKFEGNFEGF